MEQHPSTPLRGAGGAARQPRTPARLSLNAEVGHAEGAIRVQAIAVVPAARGAVGAPAGASPRLTASATPIIARPRPPSAHLLPTSTPPLASATAALARAAPPPQAGAARPIVPRAASGPVESVATLEPTTRTAVIAGAHDAALLARYSGAEVRPSAREWRLSEALRRAFWLCPRCRITNAADADACSRCHEERHTVLRSTAAGELEALERIREYKELERPKNHFQTHLPAEGVAVSRNGAYLIETKRNDRNGTSEFRSKDVTSISKSSIPIETERNGTERNES